jgi:hypothetical protein
VHADGSPLRDKPYSINPPLGLKVSRKQPLDASTQQNEPSEPSEVGIVNSGVIAVPDATSIPGMRSLLVALVVAVIAAVLAWSLTDRLRVTEVVQSVGKFGGAQLSVPRATRNGAVASAILGAILSIGLGVTSGLLVGHRSSSRVVQAGLAGLVLGAAGGAAGSYALHPLYYNHMDAVDLRQAMLIHLGVWTAIGAAAGIAFGIGSGRRDIFIRSLAGGITGAILGTLLFDVAGAFFPVAHTERPLAEEAGTRLAANLLLSACVAIGIVVVAAQRPRVAANNP